MSRLDSELIQSLLDRCISESRPSTAAYLSVRSLQNASLETVDVVAGIDHAGKAASPNDLLCVGCLTKPLLPLLLARSAPHVLQLPVQLFFANQPRATWESVRSILVHSARIGAPSALDWRLRGSSMSDDEVAMAMISSEGFTYSDFAAWVVLEKLFLHETGRAVADAIVDDILSPLGLLDVLIVDPRMITDLVKSKISLPVIMCDDVKVPLYSEGLWSELQSIRPAFGALASCSAIADVYGQLLLVLNGEVVDGLPSEYMLTELLGDPGPAVEFPSVAGSVRFVGGFISNSHEAPFRPFSDSSFGHLGGIGLGGSFVDPALRVAVAYYFNGMADPSEHVEVKKELLAGIYSLVES